MFFSYSQIRVFLYGEPIDMRSGFERLCYFVREPLGQDLLQGQVYLFLGKNRRRAKVLYFDGTGLVLVHKRLEQGLFMGLADLREVRELKAVELALLFSGQPIRVCLGKRGRIRDGLGIPSEQPV